MNKDTYCWICHREGTTIFCPLCPLGFHYECAVNVEGNINRNTLRPSCRQCRILKESEDKWSSSRDFPCMTLEDLNFVLLRMAHYSRPWPPRIMQMGKRGFLNLQLIQFMNLQMVRTFARTMQYECPEEFLFDLRIIKHNLIIRFSPEGRDISRVTEYIRKMEMYCEFMDMCPYCQLHFNQRRANWFIEVCPWPHTLVLAQRPGFKLWPGKLKKYLPDRKKVLVGFFGKKHRVTEVDFTDCFHLVNPRNVAFYETLITDSHRNWQNNYIEAIEEMQTHVAKLRQAFPSIRYSNELKNWLPADGVFAFKCGGDARILQLTRSFENLCNTINNSSESIAF